MNGEDLKKIEEAFKRSIGVLSEDFQHRLDIVVEGQQMLAGKMDGMEERLEGKIDQVDQSLMKVEVRLDRVEKKVNILEKKVDSLDNKIGSAEMNLTKKIDAVAADLAAHRADTEIHSGYKVSE